MKETRILMDMPLTVEIADSYASQSAIDEIFAYFSAIEDRFSVFRKDSEITLINERQIQEGDYSKEMKEIFLLAEQAKKETKGYFNIIAPSGKLDPSGVVKGWAIKGAADILLDKGFKNFYIDAGGDIQVHGKNAQGKKWSIGIKNPFDAKQIVKVVYLSNEGIATSGTYIRGQHIYNPHEKNKNLTNIVSVTVIGKDVLQADLLATALFAMEKEGMPFAENLKGPAAYSIDKNGIATLTSNFQKYTASND